MLPAIELPDMEVTGRWTPSGVRYENSDEAQAEGMGMPISRFVEYEDASPEVRAVYDDIKAIGKDFAGMDVATWVADKKKELDADASVKNEMSAMKSFKKAAANEEKAGGKAKKMGPAIKGYKRVVKKYAGTRAAKNPKTGS